MVRLASAKKRRPPAVTTPPTTTPVPGPGRKKSETIREPVAEDKSRAKSRSNRHARTSPLATVGFIKMSVALPLIVAERRGANLRMLPAGVIDALYVHVPFCFHKCHYCDFYSITRQTPQRMAAFVDRLFREADLWLDADHLAIRPRTIFFGGGTPSLLPIDQMNRLLAGLAARFDLSAVDEWTVEVNPATADADYLAMLRANGVDRLSFGAQSFDRRELALLERHHDPDDVARSVDLARSAGFERINLDLIFAVAGQTMESWSRSLEAAIALATPHLSCYALTYETNTPLAVRRRLGQFVAVEDDLELAMLRHTRERLREVGLPAYEISNFARLAPTDEACRHNLNYWTGGNYLALGPSGASHVEGTRFKNRPHLGEWERAIDALPAGELPATDVETLSPEQRAGELAMLMLRLTGGVRYDAFDRLDLDPTTLFAAEMQEMALLGLIEVTTIGFRLTDRAIGVADAVAEKFVRV